MKKINLIILFFLILIPNCLAQNNIDVFNYYYKKGDLKTAFIFGEKIRKTVELNSEINQTIKNAILLENIASLYKGKGKYEIAESLYSQSITIKKKIIGENNLDYSDSLNELAIVYANRGRYLKAESLFIKSLTIRKKILGENHIDYAGSVHNLANIYEENGEYAKAETLYIQSLTIIKKNAGENHSNYMLCSNSLATLYQKTGEFSKAEQIYLELVAINKRKTGDNNLKDIRFLNNLALFYSSQGLYSKAEPLLLELLKISKEILGENDLGYSRALENMAGFYRNKGQYTKAIQLCLQSLAIKKMKFGENHPDYALSLNNLAGLYVIQEDYAKAEQLLLKTLIIRKKILGENHLTCSSSLNNLAILYQNQGKYKEAESLFLQSFEIKKKNLGVNHPDYIFTINNLALFYQLYDVRLNNEKVTGYFQSGFSPFKKQILDASNYLSENELSLFRLDRFSNRFYPLSFLHRYPLQYSTINIGCYENELLVKNISLRNQQRIKNNILKSNNTVLKQQYEQFITNKRYLTKLEELPLTKRPANYDQLKTETEILEKNITRKSSEFAEAKKSLNITWKQIQEKLKPNEVVIDLVAYNFYNKKWTDSVMYGAFVIKKDSKFPKFISLFEEKQLAVLLERNKQAHDSIQSKIINKQYLDRAISDLFYKPLEAELKNGTTIYLAPAGLTHQINFKALPILENQTFGEKFKIKLLGSSASIVDYKATTFSNKQPLEFVLYGGIDYNKRSKEDEENHNKPHDRLNELATRSDISEFKYLKGTNEEVQRIKTEAEKYNFTTTIYKEKNATEESVKQLDGRENPFVLHLATHGYFFENVKQEVSNSDKSISENPKRSIYSVAEDPMMRSGLLLSGANNSWGKTNNETNLDDGILTAKEISNLDLSNCQLVVLSACETGLGDINGSEGVFGLQRAFKMAGVKNIIMSLWKVPDAQTAELFESFYAECFKGKTIHEGFQEAQNKMKTKYPPFFWAGFVLLE